MKTIDCFFHHVVDFCQNRWYIIYIWVTAKYVNALPYKKEGWRSVLSRQHGSYTEDACNGVTPDFPTASHFRVSNCKGA